MAPTQMMQMNHSAVGAQEGAGRADRSVRKLTKRVSRALVSFYGSFQQLFQPMFDPYSFGEAEFRKETRVGTTCFNLGPSPRAAKSSLCKLDSCRTLC